MQMDADEIVLIADPRVLKIPIKENGEPLIDLKETGQILYGPPPETPASSPYYTKMRKSVFERLLEAQNLLPNGVRFRLYEGWRSLSLQKELFVTRYQQIKNRGEFKTHEEIFKETTKLVSPVINLSGEPNVPPHTTGAAIDVELVDETGSLLDMGMVASEWEESERLGLTFTYASNISREAKKNRALMISVLAKVGFVNYPTEWWHWSYGDRYWAYHVNHPYAIYGSLV